MSRFYFMHREFDGLCLSLDEPIESRDIQLLFADSWYWLHYRFFNCRDGLCSETSSAIRTHLYNMIAMIYREFEQMPELLPQFEQASLLEMIEELIEIAEYSRSFPICLWIHGDQTSKELLDEWLAKLPSNEQLENFAKLPHVQRMERERLPYAFDEESQAMKRYRRELADFGRRNKIKVKNAQRATNGEVVQSGAASLSLSRSNPPVTDHKSPPAARP